METLDALCAIMKENTLAAGAYALALDPVPVVLDAQGWYAACGTFHGPAPLGGPWDRSSDPQASFEAPVRVPLTHADDKIIDALLFARVWRDTVARAFASMATHPLALAQWLGPDELGSAQTHRRLGVHRDARTEAGLRALFAQSHTLAPFVCDDVAAFERARAALDAEREAEGSTLGRSAQGEVTLCEWLWRVGELRAQVQLMVYDEHGKIEDIKEQDVFVATAAELGDAERLLAIVGAMRDELPAYLAALGRQDLQTSTPHDLLEPAFGMRALKKPRTREDFAIALRKRWRS